MYKKLILLIVSMSLFSGCAVGVKHDYEVRQADLGFKSNASVNVATLDHRQYVQSGKKPEDFVGLSRGGFGNPFDVNTKSGDPLADDISDSLVSSLANSGLNARKVILKPGQSQASAIEALQKVKANRYLLFLLSEWKGDSMMNVAFIYDFEVYVLNEDGNILARKQYEAKENLGPVDGFTPGGVRQINKRFKSFITEIFSSREIQESFMVVTPDERSY